VAGCRGNRSPCHPDTTSAASHHPDTHNVPSHDLPTPGLQTKVDDAVRHECPQGSGDDSDEEEDEQQRLPQVTIAALL
jgi:hypothetical protein